MRWFGGRHIDPRRISTPLALAELEVLADEALKTARDIKKNVALLRAQDQVIQLPTSQTSEGDKT